jgi:cobalt-zinc-cadmium efflux system membrane fusion protein
MRSAFDFASVFIAIWLTGQYAFDSGCDDSQPPAQRPEARAPAGQVWLTPRQVRAARIDVQPIQPHDVDETILTSGTIALDGDVPIGHVFSPVTGRVVGVIAGLGQHVAKGDPLAVIESTEIGNAASDVHKVGADLVAAGHDAGNKKALFEQKGGSAANLETSPASSRNAKAELERARRRQELVTVGDAYMPTQKYLLASPVDGEVLLRNIDPGSDVHGQYHGGANVELFTIGRIDKVWVFGEVSEKDLVRIHVGSVASVNGAPYQGKDVLGAVEWVGGSLDPDSRTAKVRCTFDNREKRLRPMTRATVQISVSHEQSLALPRSALLRLGDETVVFVEESEGRGRVRFRRTAVEADEGESSPWLLVKGGVREGQKVVVSGAILLSQEL